MPDRLIPEARVSPGYALDLQAVQSPRGDLSYCSKFYREYIGGQEPRHLREDFCGTALLAATWCKGGMFRSAIGLDLDLPTLEWGAEHNGALLGGNAGRQLALMHGNVLDDIAAATRVPYPFLAEGGAEQRSEYGDEDATSSSDDEEGDDDPAARRCDIVCAFNFGVCLLHTRAHLLRYFRLVRASLDPRRGGIFVADLLGGWAAERDILLPRVNSTTGLEYTWAQRGFDPVTRRMAGTISLRDPQTRTVMRDAFRYEWRLWTVPDVVELLRQAGFDAVHVWIRPIKDADEERGASDGTEEQEEEASSSSHGGGSSASSDDDDGGEYDFQPYAAMRRDDMPRLQRGWSAYLVAVCSARVNTNS